jgi:C_GCAxxG_C_C family probable redox protein
MNAKKLFPTPTRRDFVRRASIAAAASSVAIIDTSTVFGTESLSRIQGNPGENKVSQPTLNCAETILSRANDLYELELTPEDMSFASAFGGGMGIGDKCGTVTGSLMVIGYLFKNTTGESSPVKKISGEFLKAFNARMASLDCSDLRKTQRTQSEGCGPVINAAMELLETTVKNHYSRRLR